MAFSFYEMMILGEIIILVEVETLKRNFLYFALGIGTIVSEIILGLLESRIPHCPQLVPSVRIKGSEKHNPSKYNPSVSFDIELKSKLLSYFCILDTRSIGLQGDACLI